MTLDRPDVAQIRLDNALALFAEFVHNAAKNPDAATLRGLERRFAEQLQIQPSYWSQIKSRSRQIGERLARQFEVLCRKPHGWMDRVHGATADVLMAQLALEAQPAKTAVDADSSAPQNDDERFIVGLVLTYYRRHPAKARSRLLDILGEVLVPQSAPTAPAKPATGSNAAKSAKTSGGTGAAQVAEQGAEHSLWLQANRAVAPLKRKP